LIVLIVWIVLKVLLAAYFIDIDSICLCMCSFVVLRVLMFIPFVYAPDYVLIVCVWKLIIFVYTEGSFCTLCVLILVLFVYTSYVCWCWFWLHLFINQVFLTSRQCWYWSGSYTCKNSNLLHWQDKAASVGTLIFTVFLFIHQALHLFIHKALYLLTYQAMVQGSEICIWGGYD